MNQQLEQRPVPISHDSVQAATGTARRVVLTAFGGTALLVLALAAGRASYQQASAAAIEHVKASVAVAGTIMLEDERLTMSANLAAASGDMRWMRRYEEHAPMIDKAIAQATALAPAEVARRFDAATRMANDRLVEMERAAFEKVAAGDLMAAQAILHSKTYAEQKAVLASGSQAFMEELQLAADRRLKEVTQYSAWLLGSLVMLAIASFLLLWRHLVANLRGAELAFAQKQEEVTRLALHDPLTGLANRRYLHMQLDDAIARAPARTNEPRRADDRSGWVQADQRPPGSRRR
jgi:hypothetical protein